MFFTELATFGEAPAVWVGQKCLTYQQLNLQVEQFCQQLPATRSLIFLKASNNLTSLIAYLAALKAGHAQMLLSADIHPHYLHQLCEAYQPNLLVSDGLPQVVNLQPPAMATDLALLLSTSGSTGSPKQVALSYTNLQANAESICAYLPIKPTDLTITTLPFFYSYGLSVINSHILAGAGIVLNEHGLVTREFWDTFRHHQVTSFAGVPHSYEMLLRLRFTNMDLPSLRYFTQAGGRLSVDRVQLLADWAKEQGKQFYTMYGQTEATARMAFNATPAQKPAAIGRTIPGGEFKLLDHQGMLITAPELEGELHYRGDNVMLGYTESVKDLRQFLPAKWLATGDLACKDKDGDFFIKGRLKRIIKPFGQRLNLDEVEGLLKSIGLEANVVGNDNALQVAYKNNNSDMDLRLWLSKHLGLHPSAITLLETNVLPALPNGKPDYPTIQRLFEHD
ncbi:hypothetical protein GCM10009092_34030 [Bowmanella denitrificans]|uniref:AMP-dependent synthetase/ligase domain-containing protein n=1 Tax=Bowmanella denitrificans TaxID=366582 RepID=A0ABP3HFX4_9ALTE